MEFDDDVVIDVAINDDEPIEPTEFVEIADEEIVEEIPFIIVEKSAPFLTGHRNPLKFARLQALSPFLSDTNNI